MASILQRGRDKLLNGVVLGAMLGAAIVWGAPIYSWLIINVPSAWLVIGDWSLPIYIIGAGALAGYIVDRV